MNAIAVAMFALAVTAPQSAAAGEAARPAVRIAAQSVVVGTPEAERLAEEAHRLFNDRRSWRRAAQLLAKSADLRERTDPERVTAYLNAGRVYGHVGAWGQARRMFETAGEAAAAVGSVSQAAHAFFDAAIVAARTGDLIGANELVERGVLLSHSPLLTDRARVAILRRVPPSEPARG